MSKLKIDPFACPVCNDGTMIEMEINEKTFSEAKRFPMMIQTKCSKNHDLIAFVDKEKKVRDVEAAVAGIAEKKNEVDAIDKSKDYFESF